MRNGVFWAGVVSAVVVVGVARGQDDSRSGFVIGVLPQHYDVAAGVGVAIELAAYQPGPIDESGQEARDPGIGMLSARVVWNWGGVTREEWFHSGALRAEYSAALRAIVVSGFNELWIIEADGSGCRTALRMDEASICSGMKLDETGTRAAVYVSHGVGRSLMLCDLVTGRARDEVVDRFFLPIGFVGEEIALWSSEPPARDRVSTMRWGEGAASLRVVEVSLEGWGFNDWSFAHGAAVYTSFEDRRRVRWKDREIVAAGDVGLGKNVVIVGDEVWVFDFRTTRVERFEWGTGQRVGVHAVIRPGGNAGLMRVTSDDSTRLIGGDSSGRFFAIDGDGNVEELRGLDLKHVVRKR